MQFVFSYQHRLVEKQAFDYVFAKPSKVKHKWLLALSRSNQRPLARLGVIVAKARVRRAVDRNRIKRVIRESFRYHQEAVKGLDIIVLIRSECIPLDNRKTLRNDVDDLWSSLV
ncbi:MAG: ribonuclease P protein component [Gammaproteobacteria bacterium RIFCSPHIGHO2_12_FULL_43_28]|nr:MAG: ribonuclease P protein component [Gammaproteobacteria bacterium RIFCSPHIGHO2_12_FULL_43_28]